MKGEGSDEIAPFWPSREAEVSEEVRDVTRGEKDKEKVIPIVLFWLFPSSI